MKLSINVRDYVFAHGKSPRGVGSWAFFFAGDPAPWWAHMMTYGQAAILARAEAKRRGVSGIILGS